MGIDVMQMRTNMDPLTPTTSTLTPAIAHIADTASSMSDSLKKLAPASQSEAAQAEKKKEQQRNRVRWVLEAPARLRKLREEGHIESARKDWEQVKPLLQKWHSVKGVADVKRECEDVMGAEAGS